jgi:glycosyl-4,4'-diaponeurosporenoate acyltransferase
MQTELPVLAVVALNAGGLPALQIGCAWLFTRLPERWFESSRGGRARLPGRDYLLIRRWKDLIPDGASWFRGGFAKAKLAARDADYLRRFVIETRRGEACHWTVLAIVPVFFLWNPWWADAVIAVYAIAANLPCILIQRHNRRRLQHMLSRRAAFKAGSW